MPTTPIPQEIDEFLSRPNPAVIATVAPDGSPHTAATWYLWEDGRVLVNMDETRKRLEHLQRDPRASLTVLDKDAWYRQVTLRGRATAIEVDGGLADIDRLSTHYTGDPYAQRDSGRVSAWIEVESWYGWDRGTHWSASRG
jgi:PPOX class probable F420-dependent enzyme